MSVKETKGSESVFALLIKDKYYKLLKPFFDNPDSQFYVNQIKKLTGLSPSIVVDELKTLEEVGVLVCEKLANAHFYRLNKDHDNTIKIRVIFK